VPVVLVVAVVSLTVLLAVLHYNQVVHQIVQVQVTETAVAENQEAAVITQAVVAVLAAEVVQVLDLR
jgi:uncharacterized membrane protein